MNERHDTIDPEEVARFDRLAEDWWDPAGPMRALHRFNPVRVAYLQQLFARHLHLQERQAGRPLAGLKILDIGCGAGILSEALASLGAEVTGIDPAPSNIEVARRHAEKSGLAINYVCTTAEALEGEAFDVVLAMEVVEHVRDVKAFVARAAAWVRPRGLFVLATINRTARSYLFAIVGAEYVLRWLPKGTHRWEHFVTPRELAKALGAASLEVIDQTGIVFNPLGGEWRQSRDMEVNYILAAARRSA
ncbi:MAG TPA: bifunctional 2-polyprenyl-6-hydroxyphenol methylase/3-demethylubiquinol 3-O-methyltransferase UbiG [Methylovirgula sp.]|nr:bifunctional 2-polyprenyl-6-hydroxyphenol methylase/3-demethylubiquinol 3-O-methyltransferase UbiG [Methylovirgula sp.]